MTPHHFIVCVFLYDYDYSFVLSDTGSSPQAARGGAPSPTPRPAGRLHSGASGDGPGAGPAAGPRRRLAVPGRLLAPIGRAGPGGKRREEAGTW